MRTPEWLTARGLHVPLSAMTTLHIMNTMIYIVRGTGSYGPMKREGCSGFTNSEWLTLFKSELLRRSRANLL